MMIATVQLETCLICGIEELKNSEKNVKHKKENENKTLK